MTVIGHEGILARLTGALPPVSLFVGPASVGKWTTAEHLRGEHGVRPGDVLRVRSMTAEDARGVVQFSLAAPLAQSRLVIARLDKSTPQTQNMLLKTLEEAPATTRFVLVSPEMPQETIVSRAEVFRFSLLTHEQVEDVLLQRKFKPTEAKRWAALSGGQVRKALALAEGLDAKVTVLSAVRSLRERDATSLDNLAVKWTDEHTMLLGSLCREAITGRWKIFDPAEVEGMGRKLPLSILFALRADIRPRLVVRSSLMSILKGAA